MRCCRVWSSERGLIRDLARCLALTPQALGVARGPFIRDTRQPAIVVSLPHFFLIDARHGHPHARSISRILQRSRRKVF